MMQDFYCGDEMIAAADRIEAMTGKLARLQNTLDYMGSLTERLEETEDKLAKAVELLEEIEVRLAPISGFFFDTFPRKEIKAILAEIK
jgi:hypothetical protein